MRYVKFSSLVLLAIALSGVGCNRTPADSHEPAPSVAQSESPTLPDSLFVTAAPADAAALIDIKTNAKKGDQVSFEARVGGRAEPFLENRAVFFVADSSLLSCDQLHGDACKQPWDYCCEPIENLRKHMATVQVVDDAGRPLKTSIKDQHGLAPLRTVYVSGTVDQIDDAGNLVVNANSIHVKEG